MATKHLRRDTYGNVQDDLFSKPNYKPVKKVWVESQVVTAIRQATNEALLADPKVSMETKDQIRYGLLGMKSAPNAKILTVDEDKAKRASRHAEISLQAKYCTWLKKEYPEIKFLRHEREKARGKFGQNQMKVLNSAGSMPDHEFLEPVGNYKGLYIEFKRPGESWLLADDITVKPRYADQYENHCMLWSKGYVVYFCNDLEIAKQIWQQYYSGRNMRQRIYKLKTKI